MQKYITAQIVIPDIFINLRMLYDVYVPMKKKNIGNGVGCPWEFCHANEAAHDFHIWKQWEAQWSAFYFKI